MTGRSLRTLQNPIPFSFIYDPYPHGWDNEHGPWLVGIVIQKRVAVNSTDDVAIGKWFLKNAQTSISSVLSELRNEDEWAAMFMDAELPEFRLKFVERFSKRYSDLRVLTFSISAYGGRWMRPVDWVVVGDHPWNPNKKTQEKNNE